MKNTIKTCSLLLFTFYLVMLTACANPAGGGDSEEGEFTISLGNGSASKSAAYPPDYPPAAIPSGNPLIEELRFEITFTPVVVGKGEKKEFKFDGDQRIGGKVNVGTYTVTMDVFEIADDSYLYAHGSAESSPVEIKGGKITNIKILLYDAHNARIPAISLQPIDTTLTQNGFGSLTIGVLPPTDGGSLSYQWYSNTTASNSGGTPLDTSIEITNNGSQTEVYSPDTSTLGTYYFYVVVTNTNSSAPGNKNSAVVSNVATVKVIISSGFIPASGITGVPTTAFVGNLSLSGTVSPSNATNQTISSWAVVSAGTTGATISGNILTTTAPGTVTVQATVANGLVSGNFTDDFTITVTAWPAGSTVLVIKDSVTETYYPDLNAALATITSAGTYIVKIGSPQTLAAWTFNIAGSPDITLTSSSPVTIQLTGNGNLFRLRNSGTLTLENVELKGHSSNNDSLVRIDYYCFLVMKSGAAITGNTCSASSICGGVYLYGGSFTMYDGTISGNTGGTYSVGGVSVSEGNFTMEGGTISGNNGPDCGGVHVNATASAAFTMNGGTISGNTGTANAGAGGVSIGNNSTFTMNGGTISGNSAPSSYGDGGGVNVYGGAFNMYGGTISGNNAAFAGGGVYISTNTGGSGSFTMHGGTISGNTCGRGGGLYNTGAFTMNDGTISGNTGTGVTLYSSSNSAVFIMVDGTISGNTTSGVDTGGCTFIMHGGTISGNNNGGVNDGGTFTMDGGTISKNKSAYGSGVRISSTATFTKTGGTIYGSDGGLDANEATNGNGYGHAAYSASGPKFRDTSAGPTIDLDSSTATNWGL